ncbi:hypothetical protein ACFVAV_13315 [Nocardia sp. NPDC057663]|uniref:hypothetical protein n=1 Tax=Nocardia sp. NPDC057663 TaxID=3346201 RepID=UPI00366CCBD9
MPSGLSLLGLVRHLTDVELGLWPWAAGCLNIPQCRVECFQPRNHHRKTCWRTTAAAATFPEAVQETEEVVPVNAVSTWVLPSDGVTVGR